MKTMNIRYRTYSKCIWILFIIFPFFFGMYYEFCGTVMGTVLTAVLLLYLKKAGKLQFRWNLGMMLCIIFLLGYLITVCYAVDSGMAFLGIFHMVWIFLFLLCYQQLENPEKEKIFLAIPYIGLAMCILGFEGYLIPFLYQHMYANERLGGGFQYPNTFALFLLIGIILLCDKKKLKKRDYLFVVILIAGIGLSGSRMVLILTILTVVILIIKNRSTGLLTCAILLAVLLIGYIVVTGDIRNIGRIATFSFVDSTLVGRFLYAKDALLLLMCHPLGMGHLGYYYMENQIQTGVYSVQYVHNDWLQIGLDIGWLPMLFYGMAVVKTLVSQTVSGTRKLVLAVIFLHGLLDFDLSYRVMLCIVFLIMEETEWHLSKDSCKKEHFIRKKSVVIPLMLVMVICIYISIPLISYYHNNMEVAEKWYPWYTEAKLVVVSESKDAEEVDQLADEIISQNTTCVLAYYAKAMAAYCEDDYEKVIHYQKEAIARDYFNYDMYLNYAYMLYEGMLFYEDTDEKMYDICRTEILHIPDYLREAENKVSKLGSMIDDQPGLSLEKELRGILEEIKGG